MDLIREKVTSSPEPLSYVHEDIEFDQLRDAYECFDEDIFKCFVEELFSDLSTKSKNGLRHIPSHRFTGFIPNVPLLIADKFFFSICHKKDEKLYFENFYKAIRTLRYSPVEEVVELVFKIYDFDSDGFINCKDIIQLMSYLPLEINVAKRPYRFQSESLHEINEVIATTFNNKKSLISLDDFSEGISKKPDIFLHVFCFLYLNIPIYDKKLNLYKKKLKKNGPIAKTSNSSIASEVSNLTSNNSPFKKLKLSPSCLSSVNTLKSKCRKRSASCINEITSFTISDIQNMTSSSPSKNFTKDETFQHLKFNNCSEALSFDLVNTDTETIMCENTGSLSLKGTIILNF